MKKIDPWAKRGEVVAFGQMPELLRVLRRRNAPGQGIVYDLQPLSCSGRAGIIRGVLAWQCSKVPRPPEPKPPRFATIEQVAQRHTAEKQERAQIDAELMRDALGIDQNGQSNGKPGSSGGPTK